MKKKDIVIKKNKYGKPFLQYYPEFQFNISHSEELIVCAINNSQVGIDVEKVKDVDGIKLTKRFFSNEEYEEIRQEKIGFFELWTLKESYIKAIGKGLFLPLDSFTIKKQDDKILLKSVFSHVVDFRQYNIYPDYKLAVCSIKEKYNNKVNKL
ncbi:4'-phosphopantetheinyl transferase superfamily protein [Pelosinus sp. Bkl1]|uniref:4'-phosphopantetheinyl transferase superfamily protein n=2 Tax=Pelosinus baikalensis TaxID=2892015 RepID=A0ABS8HYV2_9FIRM|nr:4'-phosphopantetheinyl transferase superfamily protein [Pelosinus baikalensis]